MNSRRHQSLPVLDLDVNEPPEIRQRPQRKKIFKRRGDEALTFIISAFYAKILIILGIALPLTDAITTHGYDSYRGYYMYLYTGSILFLLYMYVIHYREKSMQESWRNSMYRQSSESSDSIINSKKNSYVRYGSFYFRMGVTGFGIGSVIYSALQLGQYWELSSRHNCDHILRAVTPVTRIIFVLLEILFIFSYSNFLDVQRSKIIAKFGLMHMLATNFCECFYVLVEETLFDIYASTRENYLQSLENRNMSDSEQQLVKSKTFQTIKVFHDYKMGCLKSFIIKPILVKTGSYLANCTVEFNILCIVILVLMWKNNCANDNQSDSLRNRSAEISRRSDCNSIYGRNHYSVDCARAHKGLFGGILVLAITTLSLIMFFELVTHNGQKDIAILQVNIWEALLFCAGTVAVIFCMMALRDVNFSKNRRGLELEHILLLVTQTGVFMYFIFQVIGAILMGTSLGQGGLMRVLTPIAALLQSSCQTVLILVAWNRRCSTESEMRMKPGRQLITFLLVVNISLWVVNRLKNNRAVSHPNQMNFYGVLAWNIITHGTMPLVVAYRFQSTVCFYEIWKRIYKMPSIKGSGRAVGHR